MDVENLASRRSAFSMSMENKASRKAHFPLACQTLRSVQLNFLVAWKTRLLEVHSVHDQSQLSVADIQCTLDIQ